MIATKKSFAVYGLAAGLLTSGVIANADSITQTFSIPTQTPSFTQDLPFNLFDTNLGTLTSVTLDLTTTSVAGFTLSDPVGGSTGTYSNVNASFPLTVTGPPGTTTYVSESVSSPTASGSLDPGDSVTKSQSVTTDTGLVGVPSGDWGSFSSPGGPMSLFPLVFTAGNAQIGGSFPNGWSFTPNGSVQGTLVMVYTYTSAPGVPGLPEPGTWAMIGATGMVTLAGLRRRRVAKK